jgi:hypothetical protein
MARGTPLPRLAAAAALAAAGALALAPAHALAARPHDPAVGALTRARSWVSPAALGEATPHAETRLARTALLLDRRRRPVRLAIVTGPAGAPSMTAYARQLGARLPHGATLVVTAPGYGVRAVYISPNGTIKRLDRASRADAIVNPVDRVIAAARSVAVHAPRHQGRDEILALIGIATLGSAWAAAMGAGRHQRRGRRRAAEARAAVTVHTDALRAWSLTLGRRPDLPPEARETVQRALGIYADVTTSLRQATDVRALAAVGEAVRAGLGEIARAGDLVDAGIDRTDPFAGLCGVDPSHGPATCDLPPGREGPAAVCDRCAEDLERGATPAVRLVPVHGRPVPFDQVALPPPSG